MTAKKKKPIIALAVVSALLTALILWIIWGNTALQLNKYTVSSERLPRAFDGCKIAHISDLHNTEIGKNNETLLNMLREAKPDIIAITGDLIDSRKTDVAAALHFAGEAVKIAPCYYVTGNHEARVTEYEDLKNGLEENGIMILENEKVQLERDEEYITLMGIHDPSFTTNYLFGDAESVSATTLSEFQNESDRYTVLLSHRPELFDVYVDSQIDLVFSGHAHGGQFRVPFIGGLVAPNQGFFPEYDAGLFSKENTTMVVSRGVGNSIIPLRFNNRPEIVVVELIRQ